MLVFIDESGDPGFRIEKGSTPIFVTAMVIFNDGDAAAASHAAIEQSWARKIHKGEFKFSKCSNEVRDEFFAAICDCPFKVRAIVVQKGLLYSPYLRADKDGFYEYFVKTMMQYDSGLLVDAKVIIDGSGDREFRQNLNVALRRRLGSGVIRDIRFQNSKIDALVQLADMCAGAIARSYRTDRPEPWRWRAMLRQRIDDVWEFR